MALTAGDKLGPYEVQAPLGAGGMGEVYKARDTRLDRSVAIKVLPDHIAQREDSRSRFEREARAVASLNHPNICTLHDIGPNYMVMELIEGETLAARIAKGALPFEQAVGFAIQIADALDRAHRAGVTHRDIKPQNIMLTRDGVKVLDFGLAKSTPKTLASTEATLTNVLTAEGTVLGTPQYMAPEQFEGKEADARSDIWAFGAVLYEMATGRKAFEGKSYSNLVGAILSADPAPLNTKAWLERLVRRCLQKEADDRYQSMRDVVIDLKSPPVEVVPTAAKSGRWPWAVAAVATILLAAVSLVHFREKPPELPVIRTSLLPPDGATWAPESLTLSPDGRRLAFVATTEDGRAQIWVRALDNMQAQALAGTEGASPIIEWSPDGNALAFFANNKLNRVSATGGSVFPVTEASGLPRGMSWGPDGTILYALGARSGLTKVSAAGGQPVAVTTLRAEEASHRHPRVLPGGRHFLFAEGMPGFGNSKDIWIGSLDNPERQKLFSADSAAVFASAPDGRSYLLYVRETTLVAQPFDGRSLKTTGEAAAVAEGIRVDSTAKAALSVSMNGTLLVAPARADDELHWLDRTGKRIDSLRDLGRVAVGMRLSPDGRTIAYESRGDIWLYDVDRRVRTRFTTEATREFFPEWSADGRMLFYVSRRNNDTSIYRKPVSGLGTEEEVVKGGASQGSVSSDGQHLALVRAEGQSRSIWILRDPGGASAKSEPYRLFQNTTGQSSPTWSPDGRWLAFASFETGRSEVYAMPFPGPGARVRISTAGYRETGIRFTSDGKQILFVDAAGRLTATDVAMTGAQFRVGESHVLFDLDGDFALSPDGRRILCPSQSKNQPATLVQNWTRALAP